VSSDSAQAGYLDFSDENNIYVTGTLQEGGESTAITVVYDGNGNVLWESIHDSEDAIPTDMRVNLWGAVYVTGKENTSTGTNYFTVKYTNLNLDQEYAYDSLGNPLYVKNELIVKFDPSVVNTAFVDNLDLSYGRADEIIDDPSIISSIDSKLDANGTFDSWTLRKVYTSLTTNKTTGVSRMGNTFTIPPLWATFVISVPEPQTESAVSEAELVDSLNTLPSSIVRYACINAAGQLMTNDPLFSRQQALQSTTHPAADMNINDAWDLVMNTTGANTTPTIGSSDVIVGLPDGGILGTHEDLGAGGSFGGLGGSLVLGGKDFIGNQNVGVATAYDIHGTQMAGIIGGLRNNSLGIAGIAGGDINNTDPSKRNGVRFRSMVIVNGFRQINIANYANSIIELVTTGPSNSPICDIINNSWAVFEEDLSLTGTNPVLVRRLFRDAMRLAYKADVIMVSTRGHRNEGNASLFNNTSEVFPATIRDKWSISVGGADMEGKLHDVVNNNNTPQAGVLSILSYFDREVDILAPSVARQSNGSTPSSIVYASHTTEFAPTTYSDVAGSSAATAYTSGVVALLEGFSNSTLAPEDAENLIEYGAMDLNNQSNPGYDSESGWGNLDAFGSVELLSQDNPSISRRLIQDNVTGSNATIFQSNVQISLAHDYEPPTGAAILSGNNYTVDIYKYSETDVHPFLANQVQLVSKGPGISRPGFWARGSNSTSWGPPVSGVVEPEDDAVVANVTISQQPTPMTSTFNTTMEGYYYEIKSGVHAGRIMPEGANSGVTMAYTLLIDEGTGATSLNETALSAAPTVFPNPIKNLAFVKYSLKKGNVVQIQLLSIDGREVSAISNKFKESGSHMEQISLVGLPAGVYICHLKVGIQNEYLKIIKL
jgi:hypothetical protein